MKSTTINSFHNLTFYPMVVPNTGCIATGTLASGLDLTVTGGNTGQAADGVNTYLVEAVDTSRETPRVVIKKNMSQEELALLIEHHYKNRNRKRRSNGPRNLSKGRRVRA